MMFDWLKKLFGEGKFRVEFETTDGRKMVGRLPYIGCPESELEILRLAAGHLAVQDGIRVRWIRVVSFYGSGVAFEPTYKRHNAQEIYGYGKRQF